MGLGSRKGKTGCSPAPLNYLSPWLAQQRLGQRTGLQAWGTEAQKPHMGPGQGKAELDFTLAFHQLARKAPETSSGNVIWGLSSEQEAPGQLGVVLGYPAPNPNSVLPPTKAK